jgi:hypothetical protein
MFVRETSIKGLLTEGTQAGQEFNNDIYGQYRLAVGQPEHNMLQARHAPDIRSV